MNDLSRAALNNRHTKPAAAQPTMALPARNAQAAKQPAALAAIIPSLPNAAGLSSVALPASSLPRESSPRIMNPADVPLTDAARFVRVL